MNGILLVAFGEQYDRLAAHTVAYSRKHTDLPFCVLTNVKNRCPVWNKIDNVQFVDFDWPQEENRRAKTNMLDYSPFDKTLYLDCDAVIQKRGIERAFGMIRDNALLLNIYGRWADIRKASSLYRRVFALAKVSVPINIYYGAIVGWSKGDKVKAFFQLWNFYWEQSGRGREMPALACAVKVCKIDVREMNNKDGVFSWAIRPGAIVQHEYGRHVRKMVGCPDFQSFKPFDHRRAA